MRTPFLVLSASYSQIVFIFSGFIRNPTPALNNKPKVFYIFPFELVFINI